MNKGMVEMLHIKKKPVNLLVCIAQAESLDTTQVVFYDVSIGWVLTFNPYPLEFYRHFCIDINTQVPVMLPVVFE